MSAWRDLDVACGALCVWRESRGEGRDGIRAVLHVIKNRAVAAKESWAQIIYVKWQFSSMTADNDVQLCLVPKLPDPIFEECSELAAAIFDGNDFDLTSGATHYFADYILAPKWAESMTQTTKIGRHTFYR